MTIKFGDLVVMKDKTTGVYVASYTPPTLYGILVDGGIVWKHAEEIYHCKKPVFDKLSHSNLDKRV